MIKKLGITLLILALLATVLVSCGPTGAPVDSDTDTTAVSDTTPPADDKTPSGDNKPAETDPPINSDEIYVGIMNGDYTPGAEDYNENWGGEH